MKKGNIRYITFMFLTLVLVVLLVGSVNPQSLAREEAKLGKSLGEVLLHWKLLVLKGPSYAEESGLDSSLSSLGQYLNSVDSPSSLAGRVPPLQTKLELAKTEDTFVPQFGFWNFVHDDPSVSLSGAKKDEDILVEEKTGEGSGPKKLGFRYIKFSGSEDRAIIQMADKTNASRLNRFTIEFWARLRGENAGNIVSSGDWYLGLDGNNLLLKKSPDKLLLKGGMLSTGNWTHIAITWNGNKVKLYQNGNEVASTSYSGPLHITEEIIFGGGLIGDIDELRVKDRSVESRHLHFDLPIDYLLGFPVIGWAQDNFAPDELWHFYAGLFISNISLKRESGQYSVSSKNLNQVADFLLAKNEEGMELPQALPEGLIGDIREMRELGRDGKISNEEDEALGRILDNLSSYLGLN